MKRSYIFFRFFSSNFKAFLVSFFSANCLVNALTISFNLSNKLSSSFLTVSKSAFWLRLSWISFPNLENSFYRYSILFSRSASRSRMFYKSAGDNPPFPWFMLFYCICGFGAFYRAVICFDIKSSIYFSSLISLCCLSSVCFKSKISYLFWRISWLFLLKLSDVYCSELSKSPLNF